MEFSHSSNVISFAERFDRRHQHSQTTFHNPFSTTPSGKDNSFGHPIHWAEQGEVHEDIEGETLVPYTGHVDDVIIL